MSHQIRCIILIIRISHDLAVVLVWIICSPRQNIGGGFHFPCLQSLQTFASPESSCGWLLKWYKVAEPPHHPTQLNPLDCQRTAGHLRCHSATEVDSK